MPCISLPPKHAVVPAATSSLAASHGNPTKLNGAIHITCTTLKLVAASAAEAKLGALFLNAQEAKVFRLVLAELGHPQPPTPIHIDNTTTVGIINNTTKRQ